MNKAVTVQNMEEYQEDASGIQVSCQTSSLKYGLWINTTKNPRLKTVDFPQLGISLEVALLARLRQPLLIHLHTPGCAWAPPLGSAGPHHNPHHDCIQTLA